ncbi:hypothetical protein Acr_15g0001060 [Actinidia rufa]|uniref:Uncharacterized protein n=1 Tax=Actinidia rufa TaxID=165716 RepID=A0A7J0FSW7_9ERIC|nr:hypothetical protein Acr_15g0001060 [Actinidia rufa]
MELNQVQLLVHNDVSLNKLRVDHGIPSDVQIDRPSLVPMRMPIWSEECKAAIQALNNKRASRKVANLLAYEFNYRHIVPYRFDELGRVTMADSAKDYNTNLALTRAVMLPNDVADLTMEESEEIRDLLIMQQSLQKAFAILEGMKEQSSELKKSKKKISSLDKQDKLDSTVIEKTKLALATAIQERDANYTTVSEARGGVAAPEVEQLDPPPPYSSLVLSGFNEEEYLKEPTDEDLEKYAEVGSNLGLDATEASTAVDGGLDADASPVV